AGVKLYFVHISAKGSINQLRRIKRENANIFVETTSPYLSVNADEEVGFLAKMTPPVRGSEHVEALWQGVREGIVDSFGTDDTARTRAQKMLEKGIAGAGAGYPGVGTHLVALIHEGYHKRGLGLLDIVEKATMNPAKIFGMYPRKGTIAVGSDADLVLVDLDKDLKVDPAKLHSFADFSVLEGRTMKGWPVMTIKSGVVAARDGEILVEPGFGSYLRRG
ncbi:MAG: amidohydrolase family protein, partial [Chloroflexi bacterium]|nr:amidohydrolase family protein [Chloroflexota bacterium]